MATGRLSLGLYIYLFLCVIGVIDKLFIFFQCIHSLIQSFSHPFIQILR